MTDLAALVPKHHVDETLRRLRHDRVLDDTRRITQHSTDLIAIPVTHHPPAGTPHIDSVITQPDPEPRRTGLPDLLVSRGWTRRQTSLAPKSWSVIGDVILVRFPDDCPRPEDVADALLELHGHASTVLERRGIAGEHREPDVRVVAGTGDTETVHTEHGTVYALDLSRVMFSPGNKAERVRMGRLVRPEETVLDLFAGIGYFTLPMARAGAHVTAVERNPVAYDYLDRNLRLNDVDGRVRAVRDDCRTVLARHTRGEVDATADRVVLGYYDAVEYLEAALPTVAPGGWVHLHAAAWNADLWDTPLAALEHATSHHDRVIRRLRRRRVKTHAPGVTHVVLDAQLTA